ncbi:MAG TPA: hypothetical protein VNZ26_09985 [Vicinamibacterales bacterium]|jgi:hypothetical protein|nr:hypothetical protein [Vicinamibacterales bacterium]
METARSSSTWIGKPARSTGVPHAGRAEPLDGLAVVKADKAIALAGFREIARGYNYVVLDGPPRFGHVR